MEYYKNSMRYVKIFLLLAVISAIGSTFFFSQIDNLINPKNSKKELLQQVIEEQLTEESVQNQEEQKQDIVQERNMQVAQEEYRREVATLTQADEENENEYIQNESYKEINPDLTREQK